MNKQTRTRRLSVLLNVERTSAEFIRKTIRDDIQRIVRSPAEVERWLAAMDLTIQIHPATRAFAADLLTEAADKAQPSTLGDRFALAAIAIRSGGRASSRPQPAPPPDPKPIEREQPPIQQLNRSHRGAVRNHHARAKCPEGPSRQEELAHRHGFELGNNAERGGHFSVRIVGHPAVGPKRRPGKREAHFLQPNYHSDVEDLWPWRLGHLSSI